MPMADIDIAGQRSVTTPIDGATLLDVVLKSQGSARLKRRVSSRLVFSQITVEEYVTDREGVKQKLLSVPVFGTSSLVELDSVLASFVEAQIISEPSEAVPYRLPACLDGLTVGDLIADDIVPASLTKLAGGASEIATYSVQAILDDPWRFRLLLQAVRSIGKAKAAIIERAISTFVADVRAISSGCTPSREYVAYSPADLLTPTEAMNFSLERLPHPMGGIIRDRYRIEKQPGEASCSMSVIAKRHGISRQSATKLLKQGLVKLGAGPAARAATRLLETPVGLAARRAAAQVLDAPVKDAHVESYLSDEPYLRLAVVIAHERPSEWVLKHIPR